MKSKPCAYCGARFLPTCNKDSYHTTQCKLLAHICKDGECWVWTGGKADGYGRIRANGRLRGAHQVSYELFIGSIPNGEVIRHSCHNPACVNPEHLSTGDRQSNEDDKVRAGRQAKGESHGRVKLTDEQVYALRKRYSVGNITQQELSIVYQISKSQVSRIVLKQQR